MCVCYTFLFIFFSLAVSVLRFCVLSSQRPLMSLCLVVFGSFVYSTFLFSVVFVPGCFLLVPECLLFICVCISVCVPSVSGALSEAR